MLVNWNSVKRKNILVLWENIKSLLVKPQVESIEKFHKINHVSKDHTNVSCQRLIAYKLLTNKLKGTTLEKTLDKYQIGNLNLWSAVFKCLHTGCPYAVRGRRVTSRVPGARRRNDRPLLEQYWLGIRLEPVIEKRLCVKLNP